MGSPHSAAISSARRTPPSGAHLDDDDVGGALARDTNRVLGLPDRLVGGDLDVDSVAGQPISQLRSGPRPTDRAARRTPGRRRASAVSRRNGLVDVPRRRWRRPGSSPARPGELARRRHPVDVVGQRLAGLGHLDLHRVAAVVAGQDRRPPARGGTAGSVAFTGTRSRTGGGQPSQAASTAAASHRDDSAGPYSRNGANSPQPAGPRTRASSRWSTPRNRRCSGRRDDPHTARAARREAGSAVMWRRRPRAGSRRASSIRRCWFRRTSAAARRRGPIARRPTRRRRPPARPRPTSSGSTG